MQRVLVLSSNRQPLMPCHPARARELLRKGKAAVFRRQPFTIILKDRDSGEVQDMRLKLDPGSKTTGIALVAECAKRGSVVVWAAELIHRGQMIHKALRQRLGHRRHRRSKLHYRPARFNNRTRPTGWLAPSLQHRVETTMTWVQRLMRWAPVTTISQELVRFDTQQLQNPEIYGTEYQQGTLFGYEVREYLLEKWGRKCVYCGAENVPLEIEHIHPRSLGGSNRVSNLTVACHDCNQSKGNQPLAAFLKSDKKRAGRARKYATAHLQALRKDLEESGLTQESIDRALAKEKTRLQQQEDSRAQSILRQAKTPLQDAAAVNSTRWALYQHLQATGLDVEVSSGGRTKWNRTQHHYPKAHWIDAACVGISGEAVSLDPSHQALSIKAMGSGERQRARLNKHGFPVGHKSGGKSFLGFRTGDLVKAVLCRGKYAGLHIGRIAIRFRPSFAIKPASVEKAFDVHPKNLTLLQRSDGYDYQFSQPV